MFQVIVQLLLDELLRPQHDAAEAAPLAVNMLGGRIDDDVGAELQRPLQQRRGEHIVDHDQRAGLLGDLRHGFDVHQLEHGIGRRLEEEGARVGLHRLLPGLEIAAVDQRGLDAVARQQVLDDVAAAAEQRAGRDDMVAGLQMAKQRGRDRGHAARGAARGVGAFQRAHARLEHGDGGVGVAAIDVALLVALEAGFGLLGAGVDVARVEEDGFRRLAELAAKRSLMHELRRRLPAARAFLSVLVCDHGRLHSRNPIQTGRIKKPGLWLPPKDRDRLEVRLARPFSDLFNVAASRPAKSPRRAINAPAERLPSSLPESSRGDGKDGAEEKSEHGLARLHGESALV